MRKWSAREYAQGEMGRNLVLSAGSSILGVVAFGVGVVAIATPYWATFEDYIGELGLQMHRASSFDTALLIVQEV